MKKKNIKAELKYQLRWLKGAMEEEAKSDGWGSDSKTVIEIKAEIRQLRWILKKCFKK